MNQVEVRLLQVMGAVTVQMSGKSFDPLLAYLFVLAVWGMVQLSAVDEVGVTGCVAPVLVRVLACEMPVDLVVLLDLIEWANWKVVSNLIVIYHFVELVDAMLEVVAPDCLLAMVWGAAALYGAASG